MLITCPFTTSSIVLPKKNQNKKTKGEVIIKIILSSMDHLLVLLIAVGDAFSLVVNANSQITSVLLFARMFASSLGAG